jgi:hypothetical protein
MLFKRQSLPYVNHAINTNCNYTANIHFCQELKIIASYKISIKNGHVLAYLNM